MHDFILAAPRDEVNNEPRKRFFALRSGQGNPYNPYRRLSAFICGFNSC
jgi:hypothetical protein